MLRGTFSSEQKATHLCIKIPIPTIRLILAYITRCVPLKEILALKQSRQMKADSGNVIRAPSDVDRGRPPRVLRSVGPEYGLFVAVRAAAAGDSGGARRAAAGAELLVFPPAQFPLLEGGARALPAPPARATHVVLTARELRAPPALQRLPERLVGISRGRLLVGWAGFLPTRI